MQKFLLLFFFSWFLSAEETPEMNKETFQPPQLTVCGQENNAKSTAATITAVQNGAWDVAATWSTGTIPTGVDIVVIPDGRVVYLKGNCFSKNLTVNGRLRNTTNENSFTVFTEWILVSGANADIQVGSATNPYTGRGIFRLFGPNDGQNVLGSGDKFMAAMNNGTISLHGDSNVITWTHLDAFVPVGTNQITLQEAVNWPIGSKIVVTSSRVSGDEAEQKNITAISADGKTLTLNSNFAFPHSGVDKTYSSPTKTWTANMRAEVGLLSRNITVEGDATSDINGFGAHMMIHYSGKAYISGVELHRVGQKAIVGRYPFHWHLVKNLGAGQYFKNSSVHKSFNRALTIHGTESTLVENNFFYDHIGHGLFLEDGTERFNVIRKNVVCLTKRPVDGEEVTISDNELNELQNRAPASYWITNPNNIFEDNVAAGTASYNGQGHGTGYWFIMPTGPIGDSNGDPYFSGMQPHLEPLGLFKGNKAHSCMSGFDIFDQLDTDHSIRKNLGWNSAQYKIMENCTWYSNDVAIYGGIGQSYVERVIYRNNIFVDNKTGLFLANYNQTEGSLFVAESGIGLISGTRYLYATYDGAASVKDSHFVGWDASNTNLIRPIGAATKHVNHRFNGITMDHTGPPRLSYPDYSINQNGYAGANDNAHPRMWNNVLRDVDGSITGTAGSSIITNHPLHVIGGETQPTNWTNAFYTNRHYALAYLRYSGSATNYPNISMERTKAGTPTAGQYYINGYQEKQQLPVIVNAGFMYTYRFESLPGDNSFQFHMDDANVGDSFLARFENLGRFTWFSIPGNEHNSLASLNAATSTGYYRQSNGDLYFRPVATALRQSWSFTWIFDVSLPALDTDGDGATDLFESNRGRNPIDPKDFATQFNEQNTEGWALVNSTGNMSTFSLNGTSTNADPQLYKNNHNFLASEIDYIIVRMKATSNGLPELFWGRDNAPGFAAGRSILGTFYTPGDWQYVFFHVGSHPEWSSRITNLRFDPLPKAGVDFEIDWIIASDGDLDGDGIPDPSDACLFTPHIQPTAPSQFSVCSMADMAALVANPEGGYWTGNGIIGTKLYINAGGPAVVMNGFNWLTDQHFVNGNITTYSAGINIDNTVSGDIYKTERWMNGDLQYNIPVSPGTYEVELHFAETWSSGQAANARVFDISLEGNTVESQVDIYDQAGGFTALIKPYVVTVTDGLLNLQLDKGAQNNPKLCGIAILPRSVDPTSLSVGNHEVTYNYRDPRTGCYDTQVATIDVNAPPAIPSVSTPQVLCELGPQKVLSSSPNGGEWSGAGIVGSPIYINAGNLEVTEGGHTWIADQNFNSGTTYLYSPVATVTNTSVQEIYRSERYAANNVSYQIPVPAGVYQVELHFAEMWTGAHTTGARVFGINLEGTNVENALDIFAEAGANTALIKSYSTSVNDGLLNIDLIKNIQNPKICAISVVPKTFDPAIAGTGAHSLTYKYTDPSTGCYNTKTTTMTVAPAPVATTSGNTSICEAGSTTLQGSVSGSGTKTYKWYIAGTNTLVSNQQNHTVNPAQTTSYELEATSGSNCLSYRSTPVIVTVNPFPSTPTISAAQTICEIGAPVELTANPVGGAWTGGGIIGSPLYINSGGPALTEGGISWLADQHFTSGTSTNFGSTTAIANTASQGIYQTERWSGGTLRYDIPLTSGEYQIQIHLSEMHAPSQTTGGRIFDIRIEGVIVASSIDIFDEVGAATALIKTYDVTVTDGTLNLNLINNPGNPKVSAIAVLPKSFSGEAAGPGAHVLTYDYTDPLTGCAKSNSTTLTVTAAPTALATGSTSVCSGREVMLSGSTPNSGASVAYNWYVAGTNTVISTQQNPTVSPTTDTDYQLSVTVDGCPSFLSSIVSVDLDPTNAVCFEAKTMLEGPFASGVMTDNLKENGFLVLAEPYTALGFSGLDNAGIVVPNAVLSGAGATDDIVDWVVVQLRDKNDPTIILASAAMLLEQEGEIITYVNNRKSKILSFSLAHDDYYLAIFHRNHLPIMTATPMSFSGVSSIFDFTSNGQATYGSGARKQLTTGLWGMIAGDASSDNQIDAQDRSETWNNRNQSGYLLPDVTLDGNTDAADRSTTWNNRNQAGTIDK